MTLSARIRAVLAEGPATVMEIAAELDVSLRVAQVGVWVLSYHNYGKNRPQVQADGFVDSEFRHWKAASGVATRKTKLWTLTPHGKRMHRKDGEAVKK